MTSALLREDSSRVNSIKVKILQSILSYNNPNYRQTGPLRQHVTHLATRTRRGHSPGE